MSPAEFSEKMWRIKIRQDSTPEYDHIDADEFEKYVELEYETREISHPNWIKFRVWCGDQPTIIEAEE